MANKEKLIEFIKTKIKEKYSLEELRERFLISSYDRLEESIKEALEKIEKIKKVKEQNIKAIKILGHEDLVVLVYTEFLKDNKDFDFGYSLNLSAPYLSEWEYLPKAKASRILLELETGEVLKGVKKSLIGKFFEKLSFRLAELFDNEKIKFVKDKEGDIYALGKVNGKEIAVEVFSLLEGSLKIKNKLDIKKDKNVKKKPRI